MTIQFGEGADPSDSTNDKIASGPSDPESTDKRKTFQERVHEFEHDIISEALKETDGRVTSAAKNLGLSHQGLCYIINFRHPELLTERKPIRIRRKSIITRNKNPRRPKS